MALVNEKGKLRPQPPRLKNVQKRTKERNRNQDAKGRFVKGNTAPKARKVNALVKRYLGKDASSPEVETLTKDILASFKLLRRDLACEAYDVQDLQFRRARWGVLSAFYALQAMAAGLVSDEGQRLLDVALKLDARAERLSVTALDMANRLDAAKPAAPNLPWFQPEGSSEK